MPARLALHYPTSHYIMPPAVSSSENSYRSLMTSAPRAIRAGLPHSLYCCQRSGHSAVPTPPRESLRQPDPVIVRVQTVKPEEAFVLKHADLFAFWCTTMLESSDESARVLRTISRFHLHQLNQQRVVKKGYSKYSVLFLVILFSVFDKHSRLSCQFQGRILHIKQK